MQEASCEDEITLTNSTFTRVCVCEACTFVCNHPNPAPASNAVVNTAERTASTISNIYDGITASIFETKDFEWLDSGVIAIPFSTLINNPHAVASMAKEMVVILRGESSRNKVVETKAGRQLYCDSQTHYGAKWVKF